MRKKSLPTKSWYFYKLVLTHISGPLSHWYISIIIFQVSIGLKKGSIIYSPKDQILLILFQLPLMMQHSGRSFPSCVYLTGSHCKEVNLFPQKIRWAHPQPDSAQESRDLARWNGGSLGNTFPTSTADVSVGGDGKSPTVWANLGGFQR